MGPDGIPTNSNGFHQIPTDPNGFHRKKYEKVGKCWKKSEIYDPTFYDPTLAFSDFKNSSFVFVSTFNSKNSNFNWPLAEARRLGSARRSSRLRGDAGTREGPSPGQLTTIRDGPKTIQDDPKQSETIRNRRKRSENDLEW